MGKTRIAKQLRDKLKIKIYLFLWCIMSAGTIKGMNLIADKQTARTALIRSFDCGNIADVVDIMKDNPSVLSGYESDRTLARVHRGFADAFIAVSTKELFKYVYIKKLVHCGFDLDVCDAAGIPLLCRVITQNDGDKYLNLLRGGARVNIYDTYGHSPLCYAVEQRNKDVIEKLLLYGAAVNENIVSKIPMNHPMRMKMIRLFDMQRCFVCKTHKHNLSNIPCVNRHLGNFICIDCYTHMRDKKCSICSRSLGVFGS